MKKQGREGKKYREDEEEKDGEWMRERVRESEEGRESD